jgi:hypothetical protein
VDPPPRGAHGNYRLVEVDDDPEGSVVRDDLAVEAMVEHKAAKTTAFSPGVR